MDNLDKIIKLVEAGFSKEEITAMVSPKVQPEQQEPVKEEPKEETELPKEEKPVQEEYLQTMKDITEEFKKVRDDLRRSALISDSSQIADPLEESRKVLASIIDPPNLKKGKE